MDILVTLLLILVVWFAGVDGCLSNKISRLEKRIDELEKSFQAGIS
jgi:hypothetical protein